jgi:VWFA-related protein
MSVAAILCAASTAVLLGQAPPAGSPGQEASEPPTFRTGVEFVQVDVYVADEEGQPVAGLTADDFEVFENGEPQVITAFTPVSIPIERTEPLPFGAEPDVLTNNRPDGHVYLFILGGTSVEMALRTRHLMRRFLDENFGSNDIAAVITGRTYPGDRQDFTSNRRLLLAAIDRFDGHRLDVYELADLMEMAVRIPGRKVVVWFGSPTIDAIELIDYRGGLLSTMGQEAAHAAMTAATRGNIRFYMIDPRGLTLPDMTGEKPTGVGLGGGEGLMEYRALAAMTGGFAHANSNSFADTFERIGRETRTYYLLGFESTGQTKDGRYVRLEVKVNRPGLTVRSRAGYLEELEYNRRRRPKPAPPGTPVEAALANPLATSGLGMRVFAAPYRKSGRDAVVTLAIDLDASQLAFTETDGTFSADLEIRHLAIDVNHKIFPEHRYQTSIGLDAVTYQRVAASGVRLVSQFEVPEGRYQVRVATASGSAQGSVVYDVEVPDFRDGALALSGVTLAALSPSDTITLRPGTYRRTSQKARQCRSAVCEAGVIIESALTAWDSREGEAHVLSDVLPAPPTTAREFTPDETLVLYAEVYDNNGRVKRDPPYGISLTASLHDGAGLVVRDVSTERSSHAERGASGGHGFSLDFPLRDAPAGSYVLRVEASSERDPAHTVSRNIPVRIR